MAATTTIVMTSVYQQVVAVGDYAIQNISSGNKKIEFRFAASLPAPADQGHVIRSLDGAITGWGDGPIWARSNDENAVLAVTV